jgi:hypothetical protein
VDADCPSATCQYKTITVVDADGDGVVDSAAVDASRLGYDKSQVQALSSVVNSPTAAEGKVNVALRVIPHGGMVNINDAHPRLIEAALGLGELSDPRSWPHPLRRPS